MGDRTPTLTSTSYLVLGLVSQLGPCTSYEMKRHVARSIGYFWSFPHSQLYAEPARLATHGLLAEEQEPGGRRRRTYVLTDRGRAALRAWLATPTGEPTEIRDLGLLKLFFGSETGPEEIAALADAKARGHRERLAEYEAVAALARAAGPGGFDRHHHETLELGLRYERTVAEFWEEIAERAAGDAEPQGQTRPAPTSSLQ